MDNNEQARYAPKQDLGSGGLAADYRMGYGLVRDDAWRLHLALGLPSGGRAAWRGVIFAVLLGVLVGLGAVILPQASAEAENLPLRLHIVANSDSAADQALKLQVRDAVVEYLTPLVEGAEDEAAAEAIVLGEMANLERLAAGICAEAGYGAAAKVGSFEFPAKRYGKVLLPSGVYRALKIDLGSAKGPNWWCVIFPPLCFVDECGELSAAEVAADEELLGAKRVVKLKLCEIFAEGA